MVGPAIGALLLAFTSAPAAFIANAGTFAVSALLFATLSRRKTVVATGSRDAGASVMEGAADGTRHPVRDPALRRRGDGRVHLRGADGSAGHLRGPSRSAWATGGYGLLLAACGAGGLVSAFFNGQLATSRRLTLVVIGAAVLACASQFVYASSDVLALALVVTVAGGAGLVCSEVVAETVLARVTPRETLGRIAGLFDASSIGAMVGGAVLASILVNTTSLRLSFWILGTGTVLVALACIPGLRGLDEASRQRSEALARRLAILERLPITQGAPQLVLEQLASVSQVCPLPRRGRRRRAGQSGARVLRGRRRTRRRSSRRRRARAFRSRGTASASVVCSTTRLATPP